MSHATFDPDFDLGAFKLKNKDLFAKDPELVELAKAASKKIDTAVYKEAVTRIKESDAVIKSFAAEVGLAGGLEKWKAKLIKDNKKDIGERLIAKTESAITQHMDTVEGASNILANPQAPLFNRVRELRDLESRERWVKENPEAYAKEQAALKKAKEERIAALSRKL